MVVAAGELPRAMCSSLLVTGAQTVEVSGLHQVAVRLVAARQPLALLERRARAPVWLAAVPVAEVGQPPLSPVGLAVPVASLAEAVAGVEACSHRASEVLVAQAVVVKLLW